MHFPEQEDQNSSSKDPGRSDQDQFFQKDDDNFFDRMDLLLRIAASQLRDLKQQLVVYQRTMKKASVKEKETVDGLLMLIHIPATEVAATPSTSQKSSSRKETCTAMVPYVAPKSPKTPKNPKTIRHAPVQSPNGSKDIFSRILSKKLSDESSVPAGDAKSPPRLAATSSGPSSSSRSLRREVAWDDFKRSEIDVLAEALSKACYLCLSHVGTKSC